MSQYKMVTKEADESAIKGIEAIRALFKKAGFKVSTKKYSALYSMTFKRGEEEFSMDGWHGDGNYGYGKTVFSFYDNNCKRLLDFKIDHSVAVAGDKQEEFIKTVIAYVKTVI